MKRYEALFILETAGKEDGIKDAIDRISAEITSSGGKVETVQKMDKKNFVRVADKKHSSGFYVNIIFESEPSAIDPMKHRIALNPEVFRVMFTSAAPPKPAK
ncbi:MAG: 30S ribosomal protein S6 [Verrucomicrobiota bacterium]